MASAFGQLPANCIEKVRLGIPPLPISAAAYVAERGLFAAAGVEVELLEFATGKEALAKLFAGELDFAVAADTPFVYASMAGDNFKIVATIGESSSGMALVGRRDRGVDSFAKVEGKRVGITPGTNAEFFFDTFRVLQGIGPNELTLVDLPPEKMGAKLLDGQVDAVCLWEPYLNQVRKQLGTNGFYYHGSGLFVWTWNLATTEKFLNARRGDAIKVMTGIVHAADALERDKSLAVPILAQKLRLPDEELKAMLDECYLKPHLAQELILQLEQQFRWLAREQKRELPNYLRYLDTGVLKAIAPESVTVIE